MPFASFHLTRVTGESRQFAFAQFNDRSESKRFLEAHYPAVSLYGAYDPSAAGGTEATKVRISYSRETTSERVKPGESEEDWKCDVVSLLMRMSMQKVTVLI